MPLLRPFDDLVLHVLCASASPHERLSDSFRARESSDLVAARRRRWCERVARADEMLFAKRLALDGLSEKDLGRFLGEVEWTGPALPHWAETLQRCLEADVIDLPASWNAIPFQHVFSPFLAVARERLVVCAGDMSDVFGDGVLHELERTLVDRLSRVAGTALDLDFRIFRQIADRERIGAYASLYDAFIQPILADRFAGLLTPYPLLGRLLAVTVDRWVEATAELVERIRVDAGSLGDELGVPGPTGPVVDVRAGLSDGHNGHRMVSILRFASGVSVVYKPRPVVLERAWSELLRWMNANGSPVDVEPLRVVDRADYGWMELGIQAFPNEEADVRRLFHNAGALLCLVRTLDGTDLHVENVLVAGHELHLIDAETLLQARPAQPHGSADAAAAAMIAASVLRPGFLPRFSVFPSGHVIDEGGINLALDAAPIHQLMWKHINTDLMIRTVDRDLARTRSGAALNASRGWEDATDHAADVIEGFRATYEFIVGNREAFAGAGGPLSSFQSAPARFVLRDTATYELLLGTSLEPRNLASGVDRFLVFDLLRRPALRRDQPDVFLLAAHEEETALFAMDVPYFEVRADSRDLHTRTRVVAEDLLPRTAMESIAENVAAMGPVDRRLQEELIAAAFDGRRSMRVLAERAEARRPQVVRPPASGEAAADDWFAAAEEIGDRLVHAAIRGSCGDATWLVLHPVSAQGHHEIRAADLSLYAGRQGIALFLAALARVTNDVRHRDVAVDAMRGSLAAAESTAFHSIPPGFFSGIGSFIFSLSVAGDLLDNSDLAQRARGFVEQIGHPGADVPVDLGGGLAGLILALLHFDRRTASDRALDLAVACGDALLARRVETRSGFRSWLFRPGVAPLAGMSHGAAGIALALRRLAARTGKHHLLDAAAESEAYEDTLFREETANWPNLLLENDAQARMSAWCHGAAGIVLQRAATRESDVAAADPRVHAALSNPDNFDTHGDDLLCCGAAGRALILRAVGQRFGKEEIVRRGNALLNSILSRGREEGYRIRPDTQTRFNPALMTGSAGIGWAFLDASGRGQGLPSLLLIE